MTKQNPIQPRNDRALATLSTRNPTPNSSSVADFDVPADDLVLEIDVRVSARDREVFKYQRRICIWKGAIPSAVYRSRAGSEIASQLNHLLEAVAIEMRKYTEEVDLGVELKPERKFRTSVTGISPDFKQPD